MGFRDRERSVANRHPSTLAGLWCKRCRVERGQLFLTHSNPTPGLKAQTGIASPRSVSVKLVFARIWESPRQVDRAPQMPARKEKKGST